MSSYIQHGQITTLEHCEHVSQMSFRVCKKLGLDYRAAARGGLLHDYFLYDWHHAPCKLHGYKHPQIAFENASRDFELNKIECDIIKKHMWPLTITKIPRYPESFVVSAADKIYTVSEFVNCKLQKLVFAKSSR